MLIMLKRSSLCRNEWLDCLCHIYSGWNYRKLARVLNSSIFNDYDRFLPLKIKTKAFTSLKRELQFLFSSLILLKKISKRIYEGHDVKARFLKQRIKVIG